MSAGVRREVLPRCPVPFRLCARALGCLRLFRSVLCWWCFVCVSHARALSGPACELARRGDAAVERQGPAH